jgi:intracellular sulfur oxidation DsrE/DsrF family protein
MRTSLWRRLALAAALFSTAVAAHAAQRSMLEHFDFDHPSFVHALPFAGHELVLQVSTDDPQTWQLALNNAQNVLQYFGDDKVRIVVVAFGPGLRMLLQGSPVAARIASQDGEGIEFDACHNTMEGMARKLGHMPALVPAAVVVPSGLVRVMQLEKAGFAYVRP